MRFIDVTERVFHPEMSRSKEVAEANILFMSVTELVSHPEMSSLKAATRLLAFPLFRANKYDMLVTRLVSQVEMGPYCSSAPFAPFLLLKYRETAATS